MTLYILYGSKTKKQIPNAKRMQNAECSSRTQKSLTMNHKLKTK